MMTKISTKDWRNLPIDKWNTSAIHAFLIDETARIYDAEYSPGGRGSKSQRWSAEKGMIKRELDRKGAPLVRRFIEVCWREYRTSQPDKYPYPTYGFMAGFMDANWNVAKAELEREARSEAQAEQPTDYDELTDWL